MLSTSPSPARSSRNGSPARSALLHDVHERAKSLDLQTSPVLSAVEDETYASRYLVLPHAVDLSSGAGFSISGETELRMALARWNTISGSAVHPEYKFEYRETHSKRCSGVKLTVKKIGRRLRNLVMLRKTVSPQV